MKVILLEDVDKVGKKGQVVQVALGYARNYLIPRGLACMVSEGRMKALADQQQAIERKQRTQEDKARELARRLSKGTVQVKVHVGEGGKLFGSVSNRDIAEALTKEYQVSIDKKKVILKEPIKTVGVFPVMLKIHPSIQAEIMVEVVAKD